MLTPQNASQYCVPKGHAKPMPLTVETHTGTARRLGEGVSRDVQQAQAAKQVADASTACGAGRADTFLVVPIDGKPRWLRQVEKKLQRRIDRPARIAEAVRMTAQLKAERERSVREMFDETTRTVSFVG